MVAPATYSDILDPSYDIYDEILQLNNFVMDVVTARNPSTIDLVAGLHKI